MLLTTAGTLMSASVRGDRPSAAAGLQSRRLVAFLLTVALATLTPLAHGSPPDPTWIAGLYDDADHDDAILAVTDATGSPAISRPSVAPVGLSTSPVAFAGTTRPDGPCRINPVDRAPPLR